MSKREVKCCSFGDEGSSEYIIVDDRLAEAKGGMSYDPHTMQLSYKSWWKKYAWRPIAVIPVTERVDPTRAKELGQKLCDFLNADWVKQELGG